MEINIRSMTVVASAFSLIFLVNVSPVFANCEWDGHTTLQCESEGFIWYTTGCIELINVTGRDVYFYVYDNKDRRSFRGIKAGHSEKADYYESMRVTSCMKSVPGQVAAAAIDCYDAFDRGKNTSHGGGCGCKNFSCLPGY